MRFPAEYCRRNGRGEGGLASLAGVDAAMKRAATRFNLSLSLNKRQGRYDCQVPHRRRYADAVDEIGVWVD